MAAVLMRDRLHAIAAHTGGGDAIADTLTVFWTLIRTVAEPQTPTEQSLTWPQKRCCPVRLRYALGTA